MGRRGGLVTLDDEISMKYVSFRRIGMRGDSVEHDDSSCIHRNDTGDLLRLGIFKATSLPFSMVHRSTYIILEPFVSAINKCHCLTNMGPSKSGRGSERKVSCFCSYWITSFLIGPDSLQAVVESTMQSIQLYG